jgi:hypothetical protein
MTIDDVAVHVIETTLSGGAKLNPMYEFLIGSHRLHQVLGRMVHERRYKIRMLKAKRVAEVLTS